SAARPAGAPSTGGRGATAPAANARIWNLPSVSSPTRLATYSAPPNSVSRLFAQLVAMRQVMLGCVCAIAGAATVAAAAPRPAVLMKSRRFIAIPSDLRNPGRLYAQAGARFSIPGDGHALDED